MEDAATDMREDRNSIGVDGADTFGASGILDLTDGFEADNVGSDVDLLRRVWQNEKCAPEILSYEASLVERVREQIQLMEENIEAFATEIKDDLMLSLYRIDVNRTLFLLRSYLRARLSKIERHPIHIIDNEELWDRLSQHEKEYTNRYCEVLAKHFEQSVLIRLPDQYGSMLKQTSLESEGNDMKSHCPSTAVSWQCSFESKNCPENYLRNDKPPGSYLSLVSRIHEVTQPQLNTFVFCRSRGAIGSFQLDDKGDEAVDLMTEDLYILRYKPVRKLLETDKIELI